MSNDTKILSLDLIEQFLEADKEKDVSQSVTDRMDGYPPRRFFHSLSPPPPLVFPVWAHNREYRIGINRRRRFV